MGGSREFPEATFYLWTRGEERYGRMVCDVVGGQTTWQRLGKQGNVPRSLVYQSLPPFLFTSWRQGSKK